MSGRLAGLIDRGRAPEVLVGVDRERATDGLRAIDALSAWCEAQRARWTSALAVECEAPEVVVAEVSRCSPKEADRLVDRAATLDAVPVRRAARLRTWTDRDSGMWCPTSRPTARSR